MAGNTNYEDILTTGIESRTRKLADNVSDNNSLLSRLKSRGNIQTFSGGHKIIQELQYAENETAKFFSGYEVLSIEPSQTFTAPEFQIRQLNVNVVISGLEQIQNSGREGLIDLYSARIDNASKTMTNFLGEGLFSNGTGYNGKEIDGLQAGLSTTNNSGTYGNIARSSNSWWRQQTVGSTNAGNIIDNMQSLWLMTCRNMDKPDLIALGQTFYGFYWNALTDLQRFTQANTGQSGFTNTLKFATADVLMDGGVGGNAPASSGFFINTDYMHWRPHSRTNMVTRRAMRLPQQDAMVAPMLWAGNLTCSNLSLQGRLS